MVTYRQQRIQRKLACLQEQLSPTHSYSRCIYTSRVKEAVENMSRNQLTVQPTDDSFKRLEYIIPADTQHDNLHSFYEIILPEERREVVGRLLLPHMWIRDIRNFKTTVSKALDYYPRKTIILMREYEPISSKGKKIYEVQFTEYGLSKAPFIGYSVK